MDSIIRFIYSNGLLAMFLIILAEYACFPISSEIILPFSGAVASLQGIPFLLMLPVSVAAGLIGTGICYTIGRVGGAALVQRISVRFPKTEKGFQSSTEKFERMGAYAVCFGRMIPICRTYIAFIAGTAKQPACKFFTFSAIGIAVWNSLLIGLGYFMRENWDTTTYFYEKYKALLIPCLLLFLLFLIYKKRCHKNRNSINTKH